MKRNSLDIHSFSKFSGVLPTTLQRGQPPDSGTELGKRSLPEHHARKEGAGSPLQNRTAEGPCLYRRAAPGPLSSRLQVQEGTWGLHSVLTVFMSVLIKTLHVLPKCNGPYFSLSLKHLVPLAIIDLETNKYTGHANIITGYSVSLL